MQLPDAPTIPISVQRNAAPTLREQLDARRAQARADSQKARQDHARRRAQPQPEPGPVAKLFGGLVVIGVLIGAVALVASLFSGGNDPAPAPAVSAPLSADDHFLVGLRIAGIQVGDEQSMIAGARLTCSAFDRGETLRDFARGVVSQGIKPEAAGKIIGAAVAAYCPEHRDKLAD